MPLQAIAPGGPSVGAHVHQFAGAYPQPLTDPQGFVMPPYHVTQKVMVTTTGDQSGWCPGWIFGGDNDAIDVVYMTPKGRFEAREAVRHVDDPRSRDVYYIQNMTEDGEGGLWKHAEDTLEVMAMREELDELREVVSQLTAGTGVSVKSKKKQAGKKRPGGEPGYTDAPSPREHDGGFESDDAEPTEPAMDLRK